MESPRLHSKEPFVLNHGSGHDQLNDCQLVINYSAALRRYITLVVCCHHGCLFRGQPQDTRVVLKCTYWHIAMNI